MVGKGGKKEMSLIIPLFQLWEMSLWQSDGGRGLAWLKAKPRALLDPWLGSQGRPGPTDASPSSSPSAPEVGHRMPPESSCATEFPGSDQKSCVALQGMEQQKWENSHTSLAGPGTEQSDGKEIDVKSTLETSLWMFPFPGI